MRETRITMPINITMPALSPTMEEGNLAKWLVKEGDKVSPGDVIAEIETDKATMEVEAVDEGTVAKIVVPAGTEGVKVNALIAVLAGEGEDAGAAAEGGAANAAAKRTQEAPATACREDVAEGRGAGRCLAGQSSPSRPACQPAGSPAGGEIGRQASRTFASPLARRIAKEAGVDVAAVTGSGPHGRVVKADVEAAIAGGGAKAAAAPQGRSAPARDRRACAEGRCRTSGAEAVRGRLLRARAARQHAQDHRRRLVEAKTTIPHFYLTLDCELDALLALRAQLNAAAPVKKTDKGEVPAYKLSVNDMVIKAMALALRDVPDANVILDRQRHGQAQACRCRRRGVDPRRADHADRPQGRREDAVGDLQRDEGPGGPRQEPQAEAARNTRAAPPRSPTSACSASRTSPPSSTRRTRPSWRSAPARSARW